MRLRTGFATPAGNIFADAISKNLRPTLGGAPESVTGKVRSGITAITVISQLRPEIYY